jgi:hypothetical protein
MSLGLPELILLLAAFAWLAFLIWVYRDATRRGMNVVLWLVVVFFLHVFGVALYLFARALPISRHTHRQTH